jgi:hypothetical protein
MMMSQSIPFKQYIHYYKRVDLPYTISKERIEEIHWDSENYMRDSLASKYLGLDLKVLTSGDNPHSYFHYYVCPIENDSVIAVVYIKTLPVQGELYLLEMALYNAKTNKLIDKMHISTYSLNPDKQPVSNEDTIEFSEESVVDFDSVEIDEHNFITTKTGLFEVTLSGFKTVSGSKEKADEW